MRNESENIDMKYISRLLNTLIKENKIIFNFFNSALPLELLQLCYNKTNDTLELSFRNATEEYLNELREINEKIQANKEKKEN